MIVWKLVGREVVFSPDFNPVDVELFGCEIQKAPIPIQNGLAAMLGLSESQVHVIAPFIGGGLHCA